MIDDIDLDFDPDAAEAPAHFKKPALTRLRPFDDPVVERVAFAFDTAIALRSSEGEVKVFRLREDGTVKLAAVAPMRCAGAMRTAAAAPVLACATEDGLARWNLGGSLDRDPFAGNVADLSPDGERVLAVAGRQVRFWTPAAPGPQPEYTAPRPVKLARFGPRDGPAALVEDGTIEIVDPHRPAAPIVTLAHEVFLPELLRWDEGGLDVALCGSDGGHWYHLDRGAHAKTDPPRRAVTRAPRPDREASPIPSARWRTTKASRTASSGRTCSSAASS